MVLILILDGTIRVWDIRKGNPCLGILNPKYTDRYNHSQPITGLVFANNNLLTTTHKLFGLSTWDINTLNKLPIKYPTNNGDLYSVSPAITPIDSCLTPLIFQPTGRILKIIELFSGKLVKQLTGHIEPISTISLRYKQQVFVIN